MKFFTHNVHQVNVLLAHQPERFEHKEYPVQQFTGNIPHGINALIDIYVPDEMAEQIMARMEIHRGDSGDQVFNLVLVQRRVTQAESAALADAQQVDALQTMPVTDCVYTAIHVAVDVIVQ